MRTAIDEVAADYDFILLDCPPSLSLLTLNGLCAADCVLIPMQCEYYALEGLSDLVQTIKKVRAHLNPSLEIEGLLRTMYDPRNTLAQNVRPSSSGISATSSTARSCRATCGSPKRRRTAFRRCKLEPQSKGALAYLALAGEMLRRDGSAVARRPSAPRSHRGAATKPSMIRPKGLGRGLDALLAGGNDDAPRRQRAADARDRPRAAGQVPAAHADGRRGARRARRIDPRAGRDAADPGAAGRRRPLRDHRRRAPLARGAARRACAKCRRS